jgi:hypothetical protein
MRPRGAPLSNRKHAGKHDMRAVPQAGEVRYLFSTPCEKSRTEDLQLAPVLDAAGMLNAGSVRPLPPLADDKLRTMPDRRLGILIRRWTP